MEEEEFVENVKGGCRGFERVEIKLGERDFLDAKSEQNFLNEGVAISVKD